MTATVVLITSLSGHELARLKAAFTEASEIRVVSTVQQLNELQFDPHMLLLSFGAGVIVPHEILGRLGRSAYNLHAASPEFPGRDPHHHAIYRRAKTYGATLHIMTERVDAGPIVAIETFPVPADATPDSLLAAANEAGIRAIEKWSRRLLGVEPMPALPDVVWGKVKTTRSDLIRHSRMSLLIDEDEFQRRFHAFDGGEHDNLVVELHHRTFRIDKRSSTAAAPALLDNDFTEQAFRELLGKLKAEGYRFVGYGDAGEGRRVIWRHDVDFSMHRASALAEIEAQEAVIATYFVNPRSTFYNVLEPAIMELVRRIAGLGHEIGLHFELRGLRYREVGT